MTTFQVFMQLLYTLQHMVGVCTAWRTTPLGTPVSVQMGGNCMEVFLQVIRAPVKLVFELPSGY